MTYWGVEFLKTWILIGLVGYNEKITVLHYGKCRRLVFGA